MNKKVLVTGASGYIGSRLVRNLLETGHTVIAFDMHFSQRFSEDFGTSVKCIEGNILDEEKLVVIFESEAVEYIYHMAGLKNRTNKVEEFTLLNNINYGGTLSVLSAAVKYDKIKHIVLMGTTEEYGSAIAPFTEETQELPNSAYGLSKLSATKLARLFYTQYKVPVTVLRPSITYGPGQGVEMFLPAMIDTLVKGQPFKMSPGEQVRDFLYIDDLVEAIIACCEEPRLEGEIVNVASGISLQLKEVAEHVAKMLGKEKLLEVGAIPFRGFEIMNYSINIEKILKLSSWRPTTSFEDGLRMTIDSFTA